jgi:hypothetical protein
MTPRRASHFLGRRSRDSERRVLAWAAAFSILFHFSMVTLFSIVVVFPGEEVSYYELRFASEETPRQPDPEAAMPEQPSASPRPSLRIPSTEDALRETPESSTLARSLQPAALNMDEKPLLEGSLPEITLPTVEFAGFDRLRLREDSLRIRSQYESALDEAPRDSWARFGDELSRLRDALTRLPVLDRLKLEEETAPKPQLISRPAEGFEAHIEWMSEPKDRELIFAPSIEALWELDPKDLDESLVLVFRVNPEGKVLEVQLPLEDEAGVVASTAAALMKYRFEPLETEVQRDQYGTLLISAEEEPGL